MMKDKESANSPHSARLSWNTTIHAMSPAAQINAPMADLITSSRKKKKYVNTVIK